MVGNNDKTCSYCNKLTETPDKVERLVFGGMTIETATDERRICVDCLVKVFDKVLNGGQ